MHIWRIRNLQHGTIISNALVYEQLMLCFSPVICAMLRYGRSREMKNNLFFVSFLSFFPAAENDYKFLKRG